MAEIHAGRIKESEIDTVMGEDIEFTGSISFSDPFMIKGKVKGDIDATGDLFIGEKAYVEADIKAGSLYVRGNIKGNITANETVQLFSTAHVEGDIVAPKVKMENGCFFSGKCLMVKEGEAAE